jgi:cytochrome c oxidase subunit 2
MSSQDVIHSFWIPDYRVKMDVFPNRYTGYSFRTATLPADAQEDPDYGRYQDHWIFCAEYCGDYHSEMAGVLRVMTPAVLREGDGRVRHRQQEPDRAWAAVYGSPSAPPATRRRLGHDRPDLAQPLRLRAAHRRRHQVLGDENYIRESILEPNAKIHAGYARPDAVSFQGLLNEHSSRASSRT